MVPDVHELALSNGLRALLVRRSSLPVVASSIWYRVGSRDERTGETGLSHFLEHMMFKGTDRYAKGEIDLLTSRMGGSNNAFTDNDLTGYYFSLASDRWETALEIEASRMRNCLLDAAEFAAEKNVVLEEMAMGEDDPWTSIYRRTESLVYQVHPYHHPIIGWRQDIERVPVETMRGYYRRNYGPDRATLVIVGDIDLDRTEGRIHELFGGEQPIGGVREAVLGEPEPEGDRRATIRTPGTTTRLAIAAQTCRMGEDDDFTLDVLSCVLANGKASRLFRDMVLEQQLVSEVGTVNEPRLDPGAFWFTFELSPGVEPTRVEDALRAQLRQVEEHGVSDEELRRARTQLTSAFLFEEETALDSALRIGRWDAQCRGGYRRLAEVETRYAAVDSARLQSAVARYLSPMTWNVVTSLPGGDAERGNGAGDA
ncbi:MAG: insulinase family protein [Planctomycetes bacterium]|nr:insulinase family protein [Planctomycetota bacterium]MCB9869022.1 insulinase family protein [Planctomycetota bacterium]